STTASVKVISGSKTIEAVKGMQLKAADSLVIPEGGVVEIYNDFDKRVYKSLRPGKISVTKLLIEARQVAADNSKNVSGRLNLGKNGSGSGRQAYVEKGMVTRNHAQVGDSLLYELKNKQCQSMTDSCTNNCDSVKSENTPIIPEQK
ncbi:MAG: hypothetical protein K2M87_04925, partial [Muribaculaceae bacterium]|nr:hypothetical protein [Muribaculaceae bacterium]